jgi:hypothetical protein
MKQPADYEILGISLVGPKPLGAFHLRWESALTVLYGPNGAGKSALLRGIQAALLGNGVERGLAYLHIRISEAAEPLEWDQEYFSLDLVAQVTKWIHDDFLDPYGWSHTREHGHDWAAHEELMSSDDPFDAVCIATRGQWSDTEYADGLATAVREARTITLGAVGRNEWSILPSVPPGLANDSVRAAQAMTTDGDWIVEDGSVYLRPDRPLTRQGVRIASYHPDLIVLAGSNPPTWVPIPVANAGFLKSSWGPQVISLGDTDVDDQTQGHLLGGAVGKPAEIFTMIDGGEEGALIEISPELTNAAKRVSDQANSILSDVVPDFPTVEMQIQPVMTWLNGKFFSWVAKDQPSGATVPLASLSEAQRRWATLAIQVALWSTQPGGPHSAMLIDEPELALHSLAAHRVATALAGLATDSALPIIVTSHSAAFLDLPEAGLIHVYRDPKGVTQTQPMPSTIKDDFDASIQRLGLSRSEGLQLIRLFVVVEGEHDKIVLETLFGHELAQLRASILVMRGTRNAVTILDSQMLVRYTDAAILVVLDGHALTDIPSAWSRARRYASQGDVDKAQRAFLKSTKGVHSGGELVFKELGSAALETGRWPRFDLHILSEPDIIYYLDPAELDPSLGGWKELNRDYARTSNPGEGIKAWLSRVRGIRLGNKDVRHATSKLDHIHADLTRLLSAAEKLARKNPP